MRRLDRLNVRLTAARLALEIALERRAEAARAAGLAPGRPPAGPGTDREAAENELGRALAVLDRDGLPADVAAELADAQRHVDLVRRVHNDAVRDTLGLRSRRMVRWLRLAGSVPVPAYFEIADHPGQVDGTARTADVAWGVRSG